MNVERRLEELKTEYREVAGQRDRAMQTARQAEARMLEISGMIRILGEIQAEK